MGKYGTINLVYDNWDSEGNTKPNGLHFRNDCKWWDPSEFVQSYINGCMGVLLDYNKCKIEDVYNNPEKKYSYFIGHANVNLEELFNDNDKILDNIKKCIVECDNINIVFYSHHECDNENGFKRLSDYIVKTGVKGDKFFVFNNNLKLNDYKTKYNSNINVGILNFLPISAANGLINIGECEFKENKKGKFLMSFNKSIKIHRFGLLVFLMKNNLLEETNWSFVPNYKTTYFHKDLNNLLFGDEDILNEVEYFNKLNFKISDYEFNKPILDENNNLTSKFLDKNLGLNPEFSENYINSYVNITTESMFLDNQNVIHVTEKSFKPFFFYQFPMILATQGHIRKMKEKYGFDFFDDIINHSYDDEPNQILRFKKFTNEILRLHKEKDKIIEFYKINKKRFLDNKIKVINLNNIDDDYNLFINLVK